MIQGIYNKRMLLNIVAMTLAMCQHRKDGYVCTNRVLAKPLCSCSLKEMNECERKCPYVQKILYSNIKRERITHINDRKERKNERKKKEERKKTSMTSMSEKEQYTHS